MRRGRMAAGVVGKEISKMVGYFPLRLSYYYVNE